MVDRSSEALPWHAYAVPICLLIKDGQWSAAGVSDQHMSDLLQVLTDLIDDWRLLYMSGEEFHEETFESRDHAKKAIGDAIADAGQKEALERMLSPERCADSC